MDNNKRREIILDNFNNPINRGLKYDDNYVKINTNNESCIDELNFGLKIHNGKIVDLVFDAEACATSTASASIMIKILLNKTVDEAIKICKNYENMINGNDYDKDLLSLATVFDNISGQASRKKCALLSWNGILKYLEEYKKNNS